LARTASESMEPSGSLSLSAAFHISVDFNN
jgi:hypothetical protein